MARPARVTDITIPPTPIVRRSPAEEIAEGISLSMMAGRPVTPVDVARILSAAGASYVLAGAHAVNAYTGRPRATIDVDILTDAPLKVRKALEAAYPNLSVRDTPVVTRFFDAEREAIDVIKAKPTPLFRRVLDLATEIQIDGHAVVVPSCESVLAMKFASMINPARQRPDRLQDGADFARIVEANQSLDVGILSELGDLLYAAGGAELNDMVDAVRTGRPMEM